VPYFQVYDKNIPSVLFHITQPLLCSWFIDFNDAASPEELFGVGYRNLSSMQFETFHTNMQLMKNVSLSQNPLPVS
jgi:hypothetical protein